MIPDRLIPLRTSRACHHLTQEKYDCQACGACCVSLETESDGIATVTDEDLARMSPRTRRLHVLQENGRSPETKTKMLAQRSGLAAGLRVCACSAFSGNLFVKTSCSIYEERPAVCRTFEPGSVRCRRAREFATSELAKFD